MTGDSTLRIETRISGGEAAVTEVEARCYEKRGRRYILFELDGDRCRLRTDSKGLEYRRSGGLTYDLSFIPGEETAATMSTAYGRSELVFRTDLYRESIKEDEMVMNLRYNVADEDHDMKIIIRKKH